MRRRRYAATHGGRKEEVEKKSYQFPAESQLWLDPSVFLPLFFTRSPFHYFFCKDRKKTRVEEDYSNKNKAKTSEIRSKYFSNTIRSQKRGVGAGISNVYCRFKTRKVQFDEKKIFTNKKKSRRENTLSPFQLAFLIESKHFSFPQYLRTPASI